MLIGVICIIRGMKKEQVQLVQQTFMKVLPIADLAAELFYKRLFEIDPSLRPMFKGNMPWTLPFPKLRSPTIVPR